MPPVLRLILAVEIISAFLVMAACGTKSEKIMLDGFEVQLEDIDVQNTEDSTYSDSIKNEISQTGEDSKIIKLNIEVSNPEKEDKRFAIYEFQLENGGWSNGINPDLYSESNKDPGLEPLIKSGETREVILTYIAYPSQMSEEEWEKLDNDMKLQLDSLSDSKIIKVK